MSKKIKIKARSFTSAKEVKKALKKSSSVGSTVRPPQDGSIVVRLLQEPDEWIEYYQYWHDGDKRFYVETEDNPPPKGTRSGKRFLACAVDTSENKVVALEIPFSVATVLLKAYEKHSTLLDRDYEISREGSGKETEYSVLPESPSKKNLNRYDLLDLWAILEGLAAGADEDDDDDDDEDEDDEPRRPVRRRAPERKPGKSGVKRKPLGKKK